MDAQGTGLYAGGSFYAAGGFSSAGIARFGPTPPTLALLQPGGPGSPVFVANDDLLHDHEIYNVFSFEPCPAGVGTGPYGGLCFSDPTILLTQLTFPLGTPPFHVTATTRSLSFGPYLLPPLVAEGVCVDVTTLCLSPAVSLTIQ
jgi:hypothetical protein